MRRRERKEEIIVQCFGSFLFISLSKQTTKTDGEFGGGGTSVK